MLGYPSKHIRAFSVLAFSTPAVLVPCFQASRFPTLNSLVPPFPVSRSRVFSSPSKRKILYRPAVIVWVFIGYILKTNHVQMLGCNRFTEQVHLVFRMYCRPTIVILYE